MMTTFVEILDTYPQYHDPEHLVTFYIHKDEAMHILMQQRPYAG